MSRMQFRKFAQDGNARRGELTFPRGSVQTPAFMPVGTYGSVKAMKPQDILDTGAEIILGNTFHLYLRPGLEVIEAHRSLHDFTRWQKPILTDSGGFQVARSPSRASPSPRRWMAPRSSSGPRKACGSSACSAPTS